MKKRTAKRVVKAPSRKLKFRLVKRPLPTTFSGWIRTAVEDARRLERTDGFRLNMFSWNTKVASGVCAVCLGGAALVGRGLVRPGEGRDGAKTTKLACALNNVRVGDLLDAYHDIRPYLTARDTAHAKAVFEEDAIKTIRKSISEQYWRNSLGRAPWGMYLKLADMLEQRGL